MNNRERLPTDMTLRVYPSCYYPYYKAAGTGVIWTEDYFKLNQESLDFLHEYFKEKTISNHLSNMAYLSEDDAEELREAVMEAITDWLESELPQQIECVIRGVCEEILNPSSARMLRAEIERTLRPKLNHEIELEIRAALKSDLDNIRDKVIAEERDKIRAQLRADLIPDVRNELIQEMTKRIYGENL